MDAEGVATARIRSQWLVKVLHLLIDLRAGAIVRPILT